MKLFLMFMGLALAGGAQASLDESVAAIVAVGREGAGNEAATAGWKQVVEAGPAALPSLLAAAGKGSGVADNWLRLASNAIVARSLREQQPLPLPEIEAFLRDVSHAGTGRQLAFDLLAQADAKRVLSIEPALLDDPVQELRRGAVQRLIDSAKGGTPDEQRSIYLQALKAVRDEDQTTTVAGELEKLGVPVDLPRHFGFLTTWQVIGPFDNTGRKGFDAVFPPEQEVDGQATYDGKEARVQWQPLVSTDPQGKVDFNKPLGALKEATGHAATVFESDEERDAELRLGSKNATKVWVNGELLFSRDEYHRGQQMDQYTMKVHLKKGPNTVLVKCCQNEEKESWTVEWEFQLRVCDPAGTAILAANRDQS